MTDRNIYQELWEQSEVTMGNMAYIIGLYSVKLNGVRDGYLFREDVAQTVDAGEFIWANRSERRWTLDAAIEAMKAAAPKK